MLFFVMLSIGKRCRSQLCALHPTTSTRSRRCDCSARLQRCLALPVAAQSCSWRLVSPTAVTFSRFRSRRRESARSLARFGAFASCAANLTATLAQDQGRYAARAEPSRANIGVVAPVFGAETCFRLSRPTKAT